MFTSRHGMKEKPSLPSKYLKSTLVLYHTTWHKLAPNRKIHAASIYLNLKSFEGSESFSYKLCLLVKVDNKEINISKLLLSHNRTGVETLMFFNRKLRVKVIDAAWILQFGAAVCVVWCGTGHCELTSQQYATVSQGLFGQLIRWHGNCMLFHPVSVYWQWANQL